MLNNPESPLVEKHPLWQGTNGALQLRQGMVRPGRGVLSTAPASVPVLTPVTKHLPENLLWTSDPKFFLQLLLIPLAPPAVCLRARWLQLLQGCCCLPQTLLPLRGGGRASHADNAREIRQESSTEAPQEEPDIRGSPCWHPPTPSCPSPDVRHRDATAREKHSWSAWPHTQCAWGHSRAGHRLSPSRASSAHGCGAGCAPRSDSLSSWPPGSTAPSAWNRERGGSE